MKPKLRPRLEAPGQCSRITEFCPLACSAEREPAGDQFLKKKYAQNTDCQINTQAMAVSALAHFDGQFEEDVPKR